MAPSVLTTTVVGSYPQPDWLVDRAMLSKGVPRVRLQAMWRVPEAFLADPAVEAPDQVAARIRAGLTRVPPERLILAPDCGMKYLPRATAFGKLQARSAGASLVRAERS